jgi:hypothetical protein
VAARLLALGVDLLHQLLGVPHQPQPVRQRYVEVIAVRIGDIDAEQSIEADRFRRIPRDDSDRGELGHPRTLASENGYQTGGAVRRATPPVHCLPDRSRTAGGPCIFG